MRGRRMSTYDGAYGNGRGGTIYPGGWNDICTCEEDRVNEWCGFHGKYKDGYYKEEEEEKC